ncbi:hypothetical protein ACWGDT_45250 [Streptomyces avermitilis]
MKGRHRRSHLAPGETPYLLPRADPRRQLRHTRHHALAARPAQHQRHPGMRVVPQRLQILQTRHRQPLRLIHHQHPSLVQSADDPLIGLGRTVRKPAGDTRASNTARRSSDTDRRTGTRTHDTRQPAGGSESAIRSATILPRPASPNTHAAPPAAIACPTASATARTDAVRTA